MTTRTWLPALLATALLLPAAARADDDDREERRPSAASAALRTSAPWKQYASECGSCHLAFPPDLLPARSWSALLGGLDAHFGQNAELAAAARKPLEAFLRANAGRDQAGAAPLRITSLPWWRREHRELAAAVFVRKAVLSRANCLACHPGASEGAFGEHQVRVPR